MKILTWNMGFWQHQKLHDSAWDYLVRELKPDIALLQETVPSDELEESGQVLWRVVKGSSFGTGIYSKSGGLKPIELSGYPGRVMMAELQAHNLILASIHVPIIKGWAYPYIEEIFELIMPHIHGKRFIVGGDLNSCRLIDDVQGTKHHNAFFDHIELNGFFNCVKAFYNWEPQTFFGSQTKSPYQDDHLFIDEKSKDLLRWCEVPDYGKPLTEFSDHAPVLMEVDF